MHSADVVAFLAHLQREVPGRMIIIGRWRPRHRRQVIRTLANGDGTNGCTGMRLPPCSRTHIRAMGLGERAQRVELRHVSCFNIRMCGANFAMR